MKTQIETTTKKWYKEKPELFTKRVYDQSGLDNSTCDGGGNRHQTRIKLSKSEIKDFFNEDIETVIPGICSIEYGNDVWVVCPRRLLGFNHSGNALPKVNTSLQTHEKEALTKAELPLNVELGVWSEVYLKYDDEDTSINYHFDFLIAPLYRNKSFNFLLEKNNVTGKDEISKLVKSAKIGKYITGRYDKNNILPILPNIESPFIIEVMTASTSGSDTAAGTDIASSFIDAIQKREHNCPGINKRQVWGRMATQLFAKSALAESWGGKTIWMVQDQLLKNIELTTKLNLNKTLSATSETINFLSMSYDMTKKGVNSLRVNSYDEKKSGISFNGSNMFTDILLPKVRPDKSMLLKAVLRRKLSAVIKL